MKKYRAGIDLGGTNIKAGIIDENQNIIGQLSVLTNVKRDYTEIIQDMAMLVKNIMTQLSLSADDLKGIGIGSPGFIDATNGIVLYSNNFDWNNVYLTDEMHKYFDCQIKVSNDANCAALGEVMAGAAKEYNNAILLTLGTGVGGGIIINGKVFEGSHAGGAELGHTMLRYGGEPCSCGRRGCVEAYVSANALIRDAKRAVISSPTSKMKELCLGNIENMTGKIPFDAAWTGDKTAIEVVENYINYLSEAIADYVNIFRPDIVLISGGICNQGDKLLSPITEKLKDICFAGNKGYIPIVRVAELGNNAGIIGAANLI